MIHAAAVIVNARGLHARPAAQLAKLAARYKSRVTISKGRRTADASSIASLLMLVAPKSTELSIAVSGKDEKQAVAAILELIAGGFGDGVDSPAVAENPPAAAVPLPRAAQKIDGIGTATGAVVGTAQVWFAGDSEVPRYPLAKNRIAAEQKRFDAALQRARDELSEACQKIADMEGATEMFPFMEVYRALLDDTALMRNIRNTIAARQYNAEWAIKRRSDAISSRFLNSEDAYLRERGDDVRHVMQRLLTAMKPGRRRPPPAAGLIAVTAELDPAHVITLKQRGYAGFITESGGNSSHTAILARSLGMPAIVGAKGVIGALESGDRLILDMDNGTVIIRPDPQVLAVYENTAPAPSPALSKKRQRRGGGVKTGDGETVYLQANIELPEETAGALAAQADGIGLFRTEFLFLNRHKPPDEDEQFEIYRGVLRQFTPLPVVMRTMDLGQDKSGGMSDSNPLGLRAIRYCLAHPKFFLTQLRALIRAGKESRNLKILLPMLSHPAELEQTIALLNHAREQLRVARRINAPLPSLGGMIEIPAAVFVMRAFARRLDFFSIGTNDLTQYMLAADRSDEQLARYYEHLHPALLHVLGQIVNNAARAGKPITLCGEMAGNPELSGLLLAMGLRRLSMAVPQISRLRALVQAADCRKLAAHRRRLLAATTPEALQAHVLQLSDTLLRAGK